MIAKELPGSEVPETSNGLMIGGLVSLPVVGNGNTLGHGKLLEWRSSNNLRDVLIAALYIVTGFYNQTSALPANTHDFVPGKSEAKSYRVYRHTQKLYFLH